MSLAPRYAFAGALLVAALALPAGALVSGRAVASRPPAATGPAQAVALPGEAPRNLAGEAASGHIDRMLVVVQDVVECLRAHGYEPADPEVDGQSVVIPGWMAPPDSPAGRVTEACTFPDR